MAKRERWIKKRNAIIAERKIRQEEMNENKGVVTINCDEKRSGVLERRLTERNQLQEQLGKLQQILENAKTNIGRAQGKCDGLVEMIAEEEGYDFTKVASYDVDTEKHTVKITFIPEDAVVSVPAGETPVNGEATIHDIKELRKEEEEGEHVHAN